MDFEDAKNKADRFQACRYAFEASVGSPTYQTWFDRAVEDWDYYESRQWEDLSEDDRNIMQSRGLMPITVNLIAPKIDNVTGNEIKTRTKIRFSARSSNANEKARADATTDLAFYIQDKNDSTRLTSMAAKHARICGIGWRGYEVEDGVICDKLYNPFECGWDTRAKKEDLSDSSFNFRVQWMNLDEFKQRWPEHADEVDTCIMSGNGLGWGTTTNWFSSRMAFSSFNGYYNAGLRMVAVIYFQYLKPAKYYTTLSKDDKLVQSFKKSDIEDVAKSKKDIDVRDGYQVRECVFTGMIDLEEDPLPYQINPEQGLLMTTPLVHQLGIRDGVPMGLVHRAKDAQRLYNRTRMKLNWLLGSRQVIADADAVESLEDLAIQANRPDGIIVKKANKEIKFQAHETEIQQHAAMLPICEKNIQDTMGIYDESLGKETNANSGIAIQRRQNGTNTTQAVFLDVIRSFKRELAEKLLGLIQRVVTEEQAFYVTDDEGKSKLVTVNGPAMDADGNPIKGEDGEPIDEVDITSGQYDIYLDESLDVATQGEEARQQMLQALQSGVDPSKFTPTMLKIIGVSDSIIKEFIADQQRDFEQQMALKQAAPAQPQLPGAPSAPMPAGGAPGLSPQMGIA